VKVSTQGEDVDKSKCRWKSINERFGSVRFGDGERAQGKQGKQYWQQDDNSMSRDSRSYIQE